MKKFAKKCFLRILVNFLYKLNVVDDETGNSFLKKNIPGTAEKYLISGLEPGKAYKISLTQVFETEKDDDEMILARSFSLENGNFDHLAPAIAENQKVVSDNKIESSSFLKTLFTPKTGVQPDLIEVASSSFMIKLDKNEGEMLIFEVILVNSDDSTVVFNDLTSDEFLTISDLFPGQKYLLKVKTIFEDGSKSDSSILTVKTSDFDIQKTAVITKIRSTSVEISGLSNLTSHQYAIQPGSVLMEAYTCVFWFFLKYTSILA